MNQIPNIEERHNTEVERIVEEYYMMFCHSVDTVPFHSTNTAIGELEWLRTTLHQQLHKARDQEAKFWFETWYSHYIAPEKPLAGEFGKFATERIQMTGYLRDHSELDQDDDDKLFQAASAGDVLKELDQDKK